MTEIKNWEFACTFLVQFQLIANLEDLVKVSYWCQVAWLLDCFQILFLNFVCFFVKVFLASLLYRLHQHLFALIIVVCIKTSGFLELLKQLQQPFFVCSSGYLEKAIICSSVIRSYCLFSRSPHTKVSKALLSVHFRWLLELHCLPYLWTSVH